MAHIVDCVGHAVPNITWRGTAGIEDAASQQALRPHACRKEPVACVLQAGEPGNHKGAWLAVVCAAGVGGVLVGRQQLLLLQLRYSVGCQGVSMLCS